MTKCIADISGKRIKCDVITMNPKTIWVKFWGKKGITIIKRHIIKHGIKFIPNLIRRKG